MLPTALPRSAPKNAPMIKIITPPAPPAKIPHKIPTNGSAKIIGNHEVFSSSPTILPMSFPEKYPTTAEITLTIAITPRIHKSFSLKPLESIKKRVNIAAGGNVPRRSPNQAKVCVVESGFRINAASVFSCSERNNAFSRAVAALTARSASNLCRVSSSSRS